MSRASSGNMVRRLETGLEVEEQGHRKVNALIKTLHLGITLLRMIHTNLSQLFVHPQSDTLGTSWKSQIRQSPSYFAIKSDPLHS